ncbi:MAG: response regulator [Oligoflexales bacterium]
MPNTNSNQKCFEVSIVENHSIVRYAIIDLIKKCDIFTIKSNYSDGITAIQEIKKSPPDILVTDLSLSGYSGISLIKEINMFRPEVKIVVLTRHDHPPYIISLVQLGVRSYLLKDDAAEELVPALKNVVQGKTYFSGPVKDILINTGYLNEDHDISSGPFTAKLTPREKEILRLIAQGKNSNEISNILHISTHTVRTHRKNILEKTNLGSGDELVRIAIKYMSIL